MNEASENIKISPLIGNPRPFMSKWDIKYNEKSLHVSKKRERK